MMPLPSPPRRDGLVLAGRYVVGDPLGGGGSSLVFRGLDRRTKATVVLKLLEPGLVEDDPIVAHFDQEARLAARVRDPHLLGALDFGNDAGCRFIVYEYLPGIRSIRVLIDGRERLRSERVGCIALQVLSALDTLHGAGIVHRDVSPGNCLWRVRDDQDEVVLADLGCAGVMPPRPPITGGPKPTREVYGTAYYTAPEILAREPHDHRADLWSVGALMYALLTSRDADVGEPGQWLVVVPPAQLVSSIPAAMNAVVMTALAPVGQRYRSAAAMMNALRIAMRPRPPRPWRSMGVSGLAGSATTAMLMLVVVPPAAPPTSATEHPGVVVDVSARDVVATNRPDKADLDGEPPDCVSSPNPTPDTVSPPPDTASPPPVGAPTPTHEQSRRQLTRRVIHASSESPDAGNLLPPPLTWTMVEQDIKAKAQALRACSGDDFISLGVRVSGGRALLESVDGSPVSAAGHCAVNVVARLRFESGPDLAGVVGVKLP